MTARNFDWYNSPRASVNSRSGQRCSGDNSHRRRRIDLRRHRFAHGPVGGADSGRHLRLQRLAARQAQVEIEGRALEHRRDDHRRKAIDPGRAPWAPRNVRRTYQQSVGGGIDPWADDREAGTGDEAAAVEASRAVKEIAAADEAGDETIGGVAIERLRTADLLDATVV